MDSIIFKPQNAVLILLIFSLGIYYNTLNAELFSLDDKELIYSYNNGNTNIEHFFFPKGTHSYYRPVVHLSFLADYLIWMDHESGFHLTNMILHSLNAILVYILAFRLQPSTFSYRYFISFFAALLFVNHPINTEAVNFISARTDMLATFFILLSFILYKQSTVNSQQSVFGYLFLSALSYFMAILSKEVALTFPLIIIVHEYFSSRRVKSVLKLLLLFTLPAIIYFYLRFLGVSEVDIGIIKTMGIMDKISNGLLVDFAVAIGFYFKKLICPFPLNFAIVDINKGLYFIVGTIILTSLFILGSQGSRVKGQVTNTLGTLAFLLWSIFLSLLPSIAISLTDIAWTPYAERYLYLPSVFFCILFSFQFSSLVSRPSSLIIMTVIALVFSVATYNRNILWLSNLTMWEDTIKKSPKFGNAYNEYGVALIMKGQNEEAKEQFLKAMELGYKTTPLFNLGYLAMRNNDFELAEDYFNKGLRIMPDAAAYRKLGYIYEEKVVKDNNREYLLRAVENYENAYKLDKSDEFLVLKLAGLYYRTARYEDAKSLLQGLIKNNSISYIEKPAKKLLGKIFETDRLK